MADIEVYDPHNMIHENAHMVRDLEKSLQQDLRLQPAEFDKIVVSGMGGSAIGGDIVADALYSVSKYPVTVVRYPELPGWVDDRTLVIVSSYSGNTMETLSAYDQAKERGCTIVAITSGGGLMEKCMADNVPVISIKEGIQPRNAVGYTVGYVINVIASMGGPDIRKECMKSIPALKKYLDDIVPLDSLPRQIALEIYGHLPVIYAVPEMHAIASRWRAQFNENAKIVAFDGHLPDTNHNDILGLINDGGRTAKPILLTDRNQSRMMKEIVNNTLNTLKERGLSPYVVTISGKNTFERTFKTMLLGDFISLHLAFFQSIDPSDVSSIKKLKRSVTAKLLGRKKRK
ncbi:MAG: bifunctional phosphoglucose/phosphomannose isomerase [Candidatus Methanomethylophilaceae archaeon]|nr:bifunctional phosphoglucose/phosphomannose isomerase [Candidatus Methanomethylophilaceae archaeon]